MTTLFDAKAVQAEAEKEVREERMKLAKEKLKTSLKKIESARIVLANCQREHDDLLAAIADGNG